MIDGHGDDAYKYGAIRLNFSSNVYNGMDHTGLHRHLSRCMECIHTYPEPEPYSLEKNLAAYEHLSPEEVCVTNGATEAIYLIAQAFRGCVSVIRMPTFSEYADACRLHEHRVLSFYRFDGFPENAGLVWLCNPNNPTGEVWEKAELLHCIETHPDMVFIVDQSYESFTLKLLLWAEEAVRYPNILLLHSMTKRFAVPGLRLGYVTACSGLLRKIRLQRMPWSVNSMAMEAGLYLLDHAGEYAMDIPCLLKERERLAESLSAVGGMEVWPSDTHFLLVRLRVGTAVALKTYLATEHGILIRDASNFDGLDERFFRIAVQTPTENDELVACIKEWMYMY